MPRLLTLLFGFTALCGFCGCPSGAPAPTAPAGGAQTTTNGGGGQEAATATSGAPMEGGSETGDAADSGDTTDSGGATAPAGFESPEAAFAAAQQAARDSEWRSLVECMTPDGQKFVAGMMMFMAAGGGEEAAPLLPVLEKHGVEVPKLEFSVTVNGDTDSAGSDEESEEASPEEPEIEDLPGFIADMIAAMEASGMDSGSGTGPAEWGNAELTEVTIDGDTASGTLLVPTDNGEQTEPIAFTKTDDGWLLDISMTSGPGGPGGPMVGEEGPSEPLTEAVLEEGLKSTIDLTFEQPFEQEFFGKEFPEGSLYVTLNLVGDVILDAYEYGQFEVVAAEDDTGKALELAGPVTNGFDEEFGEEFVELNAFFLDEKDTLPIRFALTPPAEGAEQLAILELSLKLKARESIVVEDVLASLGETITVEDIGDFTINKQDADNGLQIEFKGAGAGVESVTLTDGEGMPLDTDSTFQFGFGDSKTFGITTEGKLPEGTQMRVTLEGSESIKVVPLMFEDLDLTR